MTGSIEHPVSTRDFVVNVSSLRRTPGSVQHELLQASIAGLAITEAAVAEDALISVEADLAEAQSTVVVTATVMAPWTGECRRCLGPASGHVQAEVREVYEERNAKHEGDRDEGEETYLMEGDRLDLGPLVRDAVLLGLPPAPLCREECRGLCPQCGADLNVESCGCEAPIDPRWVALDALKGDLEGAREVDHK